MGGRLVHSMGDAESKRLILARRARFVAAALASASAIAQAGACSPQPCLEPVPSPAPDAGDAGRDASPKADGGVAVDDSGQPQPCLTIAQDAESK